MFMFRFIFMVMLGFMCMCMFMLGFMAMFVSWRVVHEEGRALHWSAVLGAACRRYT